ncbi:MAG: hypothetical protein COZ34_01240 [Candidatus Pacebacteria bacterium CG_4_10_14_3_um_filter_34_15]|nr:hypothetical protein [Candidatus Pacearchaeota archaeon]NCQ65288.1 hypothetical protein [Candidatus Paceibacterota bacterium]OIO44989.1 MAG: hypothetical protein AUJ41_00970 [Candidatus Pacebacteria bacterium CG1_02_43_31]PIQ81067.1 MAG: hypothetical protein COV78_02595 [Candidatus Pacebacteria bacterium CG11_big_fil_rev_8_21_14_0_20_34_55]PIX81884.1 MAG: hypothetical protein COZ34_01240 [Candidatus Pacebacteria bacterium CG_4_10_14_3_um_filter_34_15]PJC44099.1 MAG: hypothetical protein CO0
MKKIDIMEDIENKAVVDDDLLLEHNQKSPELESIRTANIEKDISMRSTSRLFIVLTIIAVLSGVGTGFGSFKLFANKSNSSESNLALQELPTAGKLNVGDTFGSKDESFKDSAEGYLEVGGLDGEGSHKLLRPGGESQTVYLTSSVTDLTQLAGTEIKVWGETFKGQKAGWLMDVGRVEVLKVDAESPAEE